MSSQAADPRRVRSRHVLALRTTGVSPAWTAKIEHPYPFVSSVLENIASSYDRQAEREDSEAKVTKRLRR